MAILFVMRVLCGMDTVLMNESQEGSDSALWAVDCGLWSGSVMEHMWWVRGPHFRCPGLPHLVT